MVQKAHGPTSSEINPSKQDTGEDTPAGMEYQSKWSSGGGGGGRGRSGGGGSGRGGRGGRGGRVNNPYRNSGGRGSRYGRGGGGSYRHGGRNQNRNQQQKRRKAPKAPQAPSKKSLIKDIRQACEQQRDATRITNAVARARHYSVRLDRKTLQLIMEDLAKMGASTIIDEMRNVVNLRDHDTTLTVSGVHQILLHLPQCQFVSPSNAADIVDLCVSICQFARGNRTTKEYFRTRARWCVLEFFGEAAGVLENIQRHNPSLLARQGKAVIGCMAEKAKKGSEVCFQGGDNGGGQARRQLSTGDSVRVSRYKRQESVVARTSLAGTSGAGGGGGGGSSVTAAEIEKVEVYEGEVVVERPLILKFLSKTASAAILGTARSSSSSSSSSSLSTSPTLWRIDKMANRVSFTREMSALTLLTTNDADDTRSHGNGGGNKGRPCDHIVRAVVDSVEVGECSGGGGGGGGGGGDEVLRGAALAAVCAQPCLHPETGRPLRNNATTMSQGPTAQLNLSQRRALEAATTQSLTLVQGPPGTGKTAVALWILTYWSRFKHLSSGRNSSLLACSDSNVAVDNLVEGLAKAGVRVVRLGRPENTRPELLQFSTFSQVEEQLRWQHGGAASQMMDAKQMKQAKHDALTKILRDADVICTTCVGAGSGMLEKKQFAGVLIDEASQATEIATIIPFLRHCQQLVLVGDHCQLPPTVASEAAQFEGLSLSLFERLVNSGVPPYLLDTQYRMHPAISQFPSDCFYGGAIADGVFASDRPPARGFDWPRRDFPVAFIPIDQGVEYTEGLSKANVLEAQCVANLVRGFASAGIPLLEIGVTTPYAAQVRLLRQYLGPQLRTIECSSVDAFQGREKTVMIISTVRSNHHGNIGFLADWCRTNVALTRARNGMIVVGNPSTLSTDQRSWGPFLRWAWAHGCCAGQYGPPPGNYDQVGTRKLATGKKDFLERQKKRMAEKRGEGPAEVKEVGSIPREGEVETRTSSASSASTASTTSTASTAFSASSKKRKRNDQDDAKQNNKEEKKRRKKEKKKEKKKRKKEKKKLKKERKKEKKKKEKKEKEQELVSFSSDGGGSSSSSSSSGGSSSDGSDSDSESEDNVTSAPFLPPPPLPPLPPLPSLLPSGPLPPLAAAPAAPTTPAAPAVSAAAAGTEGNKFKRAPLLPQGDIFNRVGRW